VAPSHKHEIFNLGSRAGCDQTLVR